MKICIVVPSFYPATVYGGPIFSILHTCEALSKLQDTNIYVSTTNANRFNRLNVVKNKWVQFENNFHVKYYNETLVGQGQFSIPLFMNLWKDIKNSDIVHAQGIFNTPIPLAIMLSKIFKKPIVVSPRGSFLEWSLLHGSKLKNIWIRIFINYAGNYIVWHATSKVEKDSILNLYPKSKVVIIPNGVNNKYFSDFNSLSKSNYIKKYTGKILNPSKVIVSMSRVDKLKGLDILIKSFSKIKSKYNDAILMIAGVDVGEMENLKKLRGNLGLKDSIFFVGEVSDQDKIDFLGNADLFVLPSHLENFGNAYIESLSSGTPIIATKRTPWEIVESAECGRWVEKSEKEITGAMFDMLDRDRDTMRINSKKLAKQFDWKSVASSFNKVYEDIT